MHNASAGIVNLQSGDETICLFGADTGHRQEPRRLVTGDEVAVGEEDVVAGVRHQKGYTNRPMTIRTNVVFFSALAAAAARNRGRRRLAISFIASCGRRLAIGFIASCGRRTGVCGCRGGRRLLEAPRVLCSFGIP